MLLMVVMVVMLRGLVLLGFWLVCMRRRSNPGPFLARAAVGERPLVHVPAQHQVAVDNGADRLLVCEVSLTYSPTAKRKEKDPNYCRLPRERVRERESIDVFVAKPGTLKRGLLSLGRWCDAEVHLISTSAMSLHPATLFPSLATSSQTAADLTHRIAPLTGRSVVS